MNKLLVSFLLLFLSVAAFSQTQTIKGAVTDSTGKPLKGVSVFSKGNKKGTQTDADGKFSITVKGEGNTDLIFSGIGFKTAIVSANGNRDIVVKLLQDIVMQDEVVVNVGYGTLKKREVSSAVSSITAKDIKDVPINNASEALTGRLAGVQVTTSEGAPDADVKIRVRGGGSITQSNDPLYIVDGVQVDNGLSTISPQDIQSIDVLKDAAATAIYGARGANGVIIVTTKNGKQGKLTVSLNSAVGLKKLSGELEVMDPYEFVLWEYERTRSNTQDSSSFAGKYGTYWDTLINYKNAKTVDWQKEVVGRTGMVANNSVSVSGGNNITTFTAGYTNNYEKAIVQNSNYKRNLFNLKIDVRPAKNIKFGASGRYISQNVEGAGVSDEKGSSYNRLRNAVKYRPWVSGGLDPIDDNSGDETNVGNSLSLINPIRLNNNEYRKKTTSSYNITAYASYNITKKITFKTTFGYEHSNFVDRQFSDSLTSLSRLQGSAQPVIQLDTTNKSQFSNSNVFTFKLNNSKKRHELDIVAGQEIVIQKAQFSGNLRRNLPNFTTVKDAISDTSLGDYFAGYPVYKDAESSLLSFFSRVNYTFDKKYIVSVNFRADGSSKFAPGRRWGYFPSASVAWRIAKEDFMANVKAVSDLKLRLSYGTVGNNRINDYLYLTNFANNPYYYGLNGQSQFGYTPASLVNDLLKWETTVSKNIGLDLSLFNDRIGLTVDVYENKTRDLLLNVPIASTYGYTTQLQNIGATRNRGFEIQLNAGIIRNKNFSWNCTFNLSSNKNMITELGPNQYSLPAYSGWGVAGQYYDYVAQIGQPIGAMYGLVTDGFYKVADFDYHPGATGVGTDRLYTLKTGVVSNEKIIGYPQPGMIRFKDLNGDSTIDVDNDTKIIGNATPKFSGGFNQQFTYKNWDMSIFVNFVYGNNVLNANKIEFTNGYTPNSNLLADMKDRWRTVNAQGQVVTDPDELTALNANAKIWRPITASGAFQLHSWAIEDGSFIRINNVSIGYNFPASSLRRIGIKKLRVYATGNNLAVFSSYTGYDPEVNARRSNPLTPGVDYSAYPKSRLYMFGLNATF
ncbi:MAG: TonB-dependent receptor [Chitinophagaceae bacterium]|nr:TonB-dependent receptor [Chitinophagaceae bacterium]